MRSSRILIDTRVPLPPLPQYVCIYASIESSHIGYILPSLVYHVLNVYGSTTKIKQTGCWSWIAICIL
jgi:hypothetical protein